MSIQPFPGQPPRQTLIGAFPVAQPQTISSPTTIINIGVVSAAYSWFAGLNPDSQSIFVATGAMKVTSIVGRLDLANGSAATLSVYKAPSGTVVGSGTILHTGSFDANGTPATNQTLTLSSTASDLLLATGDCIGFKTTGAWTLAVGSIVVSVGTP